MPTVVSTLAEMGLRVNVKKTCTLVLTVPPCLDCLSGLPHELQIVLRFQDDDTCILSGLMRRAMAAYVSNKVLLATWEFHGISVSRCSHLLLPLPSGGCCVWSLPVTQINFVLVMAL